MIDIEILTKALDIYAPDLSEENIKKIISYIEAFSNNNLAEMFEKRIAVMEEQINLLKKQYSKLEKQNEEDDLDWILKQKKY